MESFRMHLGSHKQIALGQGRSFAIGFYEVAVFRSSDDRFFAVENHCPQGAALVNGTMSGHKIKCPLHDHQFDLETGQAVGSQEIVRKFKVWEENGNIMLLFVFPSLTMTS